MRRIENATLVFSALADPIRLRSLAHIVQEGELCVCELIAALDLPQPKISRHLAVMRDAGLLRDRRDARWVLYGLAPENPEWVQQAVAAAVAAVENDPQHRKDRKRFKSASRPPRIQARRAA
jgi:ArsR family transcriptional regulator